MLAWLVLAVRGAVAVAILTTLAGSLPRLVQVGLAVVAGLWSALIVGAPAIAVSDAELVLLAAREAIVGATIGIVAVLPLVAAATAGRLVDLVGGTRGSYAALFGLLAAAVFVGIDGHVTVLATIAASHRDVPALAAVQPRVLDAIGSLIGSAVRLAVPWLVTAAIVELAVGIGNRVAARSAFALPGTAAVPAALVMITATLVSTLAVAIAALVRGTL